MAKNQAKSAIAALMENQAPPRSWKRAQWAWKLLNAQRAEDRGEFEAGITLLDEADQIKTLWPPERVFRALLLLRSQRISEAQSAFASLRKDFAGSENPDLQYLRRYCTAMLGMMNTQAAQFDYEARQAISIPCKRRLRERFPLDVLEKDQPQLVIENPASSDPSPLPR